MNHVSASNSPRKRFSVCVCEGHTYLFVALPKGWSKARRECQGKKDDAGESSPPTPLPSHSPAANALNVGEATSNNTKNSNSGAIATATTSDAAPTGELSQQERERIEQEEMQRKAKEALDKLFDFNPVPVSKQASFVSPMGEGAAANEKPAQEVSFEEYWGLPTGQQKKEEEEGKEESKKSSAMRDANSTTPVVQQQQQQQQPSHLSPTLQTAAEPTPPAPPQPQSRSGIYVPGSVWKKGWEVVPIRVTCHGELVRCTDFSAESYKSFDAAYAACGQCSSIDEYPAVFGCVRLDKVYFLVASRVETALDLPYGGVVLRVTETKWVPVEMPGVAPVSLSSNDRTRLHDFSNGVPYSGCYYSDDVDLGLPFPFHQLPSDTADGGPEFHCDWSEHLRRPFELNGLTSVCSVLRRGYVGEKLLLTKTSNPMHMVLIGRQNCLNPGPRYLGRGLNLLNAAGNDHFYEFVMWHMKAPPLRRVDPGSERARSDSVGDASAEPRVAFARMCILRGTIPVHWTTKFSSGFTEPHMMFDSKVEKVLTGSSIYFSKVFELLRHVKVFDECCRTARDPSTPPPSTANVTSMSMRCLNLLRLDPQNGEDGLARFFTEAVRRSDAEMRKAKRPEKLELVHVDWLNIIRDYGIEAAVATLWDVAVSFLATKDDLTHAPICTPQPLSALHMYSPLVTSGTITTEGAVDILNVQQRVVRVNCADSLDRTNLGCFFTCLQAAFEMLRVLRISPENIAPAAPINPLETIQLDQLEGADDDGMGMSLGGAFGKNSASKSGFRAPFASTWSEMRRDPVYPPALVRHLAELFVYNGDLVAMMYTNSSAMHGNILRGVAGMRAAASNVVIATQRRYENVFEDRKKYRSVELLLGRNLDIHFPSMSKLFLLRPVPLERWSSTILVVGIPSSTTEEEVEAAVRHMWDTKILPKTRSENALLSSANAAAETGSTDTSESAFSNTSGSTSTSHYQNQHQHFSPYHARSSKKLGFIPEVPSTALCMHVAIDRDEVDEGAVLTHDAFNATVAQVSIDDDDMPTSQSGFDVSSPVTRTSLERTSQASLGEDPAASPTTCASPRDMRAPSVPSSEEHLAVVEFDDSLCAVVDVVSAMMNYGTCSIKGEECLLAHYSYPLYRDESRGMRGAASGAVKKAANSLKSGLKNFMRNLN